MRILTSVLFIFVLALAGCTPPELPSVSVPSIVEGSGTPAIERRDVSGFTGVSLAGEGELIITQDGAEALEIEADDNITPEIETEVRDGTLYISTRGNIELRPVTPIRYRLSVVDLAELTLSGDGNIMMDALDTSNFNLSIDGDGQVEMGAAAASDTFAINISGDGSVMAGAVETNIASVSIPGDGNVTLNGLASQTLNITNQGNGHIRVAGSTNEQTITISGDGIVVADELSSSSASVDISGDGEVTLWAAETLDITITGDAQVSYYGSPEISENITGDGLVESLGDK